MFNDWSLKQLALPLLLLVAALINNALIQPPAPLPADSDPTVFSAERAIEHVRNIAVEPHPIGTPANKRVRDMLVAHLKAAGLETEVQSTQIIDGYWTDRLASIEGVTTQRYAAAYANNIVARLKGTGQKGKTLVLMSHYDSVYYGPGAGDDASGTATLLETLRALQAGEPLENDIIFLFTDGEEVGLFGAQAYFAKHRWAEETGLILNFEARGSRGPVSLFQTSAKNDKLVAAYASADVKHYANSLTVNIYREMPNDTDLSIPLRADMPGMNFAFIDGFYDYHTEGDNADNLGLDSLQHMGNQALAITRIMGNQALPLEDTNEVVFFDFLTLFMVSYPMWVSWIVAAMAAITLVFFAKQTLATTQVSISGLLKTSGAALLYLVAAALVIDLLFLMVGGRSGDMVEGRRLFALADYQLIGFILISLGFSLLWFRMLVRGFTISWAVAGALLSVLLFVFEPSWIPSAVAAAGTAAAYFLLRVPVTSEERLVGSLDMYLLFALAIQIMMPTGSFLFMWPFILLVTGLILHERGKIGLGGIGLFSLLGALWLLFFTENGYSALGVILPSVITGTFGLLMLMLVPVFLHVTRNSHRSLAAVSSATGLAIIIYVGFAPGFTERLNRPTEAFYIIDGKGDGTNQYGSRLSNQDVWSGELIKGDTTEAKASALVPTQRGTITLANAPMSSVEKISFQNAVVSDTRTAFTLKPGYRGDIIILRLTSDAPITEALVNGEPLERSNNSSASIVLSYFALPTDGLHIDVASAGEISMHAAELTSDWPADIAAHIPEKPSRLMIAPYRMSDSTVSFIKHVFTHPQQGSGNNESR